jgi:(S)-2-hydroxyglutarate dehydrogenase
MFDYCIIGGGIVGLALGSRLAEARPRSRILLLEKEASLAFHQTGRNSGVIHSGIYYKPGSLKARFARAGNRSMVRFCQEHGVAHEVCGKLIVATEADELPRLEALYQRGLENGLEIVRCTPEQVREREPHVACRAGLFLKSTGIVDYKQVSQVLADRLRARGGEIRLNAEVRQVRETAAGHQLETAAGSFEARFVINCGGLQSDRLARRFGVNPGGQIVPFRGEYYELTPAKRSLVRGLIYPVPDPRFPFLGVHLTRMVDGSIHAGPNAVLALKREGYFRISFNAADCFETLSFPGFWKMASAYYREGFQEIYRSLSKAAFTRSLQRLVPEIQETDLVPSGAGVRAQAILPDGKLVDDFLIVRGRNSLHVCNAPSPAATASLEIANALLAQIPGPADAPALQPTGEVG